MKLFNNRGDSTIESMLAIFMMMLCLFAMFNLANKITKNLVFLDSDTLDLEEKETNKKYEYFYTDEDYSHSYFNYIIDEYPSIRDDIDSRYRTDISEYYEVLRKANINIIKNRRDIDELDVLILGSYLKKYVFEDLSSYNPSLFDKGILNYTLKNLGSNLKKEKNKYGISDEKLQNKTFRLSVLERVRNERISNFLKEEYPNRTDFYSKETKNLLEKATNISKNKYDFLSISNKGHADAKKYKYYDIQSFLDEKLELNSEQEKLIDKLSKTETFDNMTLEEKLMKIEERKYNVINGINRNKDFYESYKKIEQEFNNTSKRSSIFNYFFSNEDIVIIRSEKEIIAKKLISLKNIKFHNYMTLMLDILSVSCFILSSIVKVVQIKLNKKIINKRIYKLKKIGIYNSKNKQYIKSFIENKYFFLDARLFSGEYNTMKIIAISHTISLIGIKYKLITVNTIYLIFIISIISFFSEILFTISENNRLDKSIIGNTYNSLEMFIIEKIRQTEKRENIVYSYARAFLKKFKKSMNGNLLSINNKEILYKNNQLIMDIFQKMLFFIRKNELSNKEKEYLNYLLKNLNKEIKKEKNKVIEKIKINKIRNNKEKKSVS